MRVHLKLKQHTQTCFSSAVSRITDSIAPRILPLTMTSEHTSSPYPPVRRVITGHTPSGKSTFVEDKPVTAHVALEGLDWLFTGLYRHDEFPASNQDPSKSNEDVRFTDVIASKPKELFSRTGTTFWGIDVPPHSKSVGCRGFAKFIRTLTQSICSS